MLTLAITTKIFAYLPPADMRKGFSGLDEARRTRTGHKNWLFAGSIDSRPCPLGGSRRQRKRPPQPF
jgi:hypothetical protein